MAFPSQVPSSRTFDPGAFPVKIFRAENGKEVRILQGSTRTDLKLSLTYANVTDAQAQAFLNHYDDSQGTLKRFNLGSEVKEGFEGSGSSFFGNTDAGVRYRYEQAPQFTQVRPGITTVTVNLIGVL